MAIDLAVVQGDTGRTLRKQLLDDDGTAPDLTDALSVSFRVRPSDRSRISSVTLASVLDATGGFVEHVFTANEVKYAGLLIADVVVVGADARPKTYPANGYWLVQVTPFP